MPNTDPSAIFRPQSGFTFSDPELQPEPECDPDPRFPMHLLPWPVQQYVQEASGALGCDPAYVAVPMLAALASAIGNTRRIRLKPTWTEPAVIWAAVVGDSGTVKSPALELALRPIWKHQKTTFQNHAALRAEHKTAMMQWSKAKKHERGEPPDPPHPCQHALCMDITIEALADRLMASPRGTLVAPDELAGWFGSFNQYKAGGGDVAQWLSLFGARPLKVDRKTGDRTTIFVPQAAVSVTGTIQPQTLRRVLTPEFFGNGLTARMLLVMPASTPRRWTDREIDPLTDQSISDLFQLLFNLKPAPGPDGEDHPVLFDLTPDARQIWVDFVNKHGQEMDGLDTQQRAAYSKLEAYAARFALIFHCIQTATKEVETDAIPPSTIECGIELVRWFWTQTLAVYQTLHRSEGEQVNDQLIDLIRRKGGTITIREVQRGSVRYRPSGAAVEALQELVDAEKGEWFFPPTNPQGGKPVAAFKLLTA